MLLDELYQTIEKLNGRMETHRDKLSQSEALTRNALVDPLLRCLGWDTEDPSLVMPEYKLGNGFADYALLNGGKPVIVIEAKKLDTPLDDAASQGIHYCVNDGIKYFAVTDGRKWDIYETHRPVPLADKKIVGFDITNPTSDVCLEALALWRRNIQSGIIRKAQRPLLGMESQENQSIPLGQADESTEFATISPITQPEGNWQPLPQVRPLPGEKPMEIQFPDGSTTAVKHWSDIPCQAVNWLSQQVRLDETGIPLRKGNRYIISASPVHPSQRDFTATKKIGRFYLEADYSTADQVKNANLIIEKVGKGVRPEQFSVRLPR